ncbi:Hypothetical predicted protein [Paramuricea clavata]|uniref:Uncharacterized protein n=1 Tax=Paramuricea clavata TaxID=317549 RepID=A0A7D9ME56_PARCT|nr:Hypothetical predicted protein [Paramuricea clavata]
MSYWRSEERRRLLGIAGYEALRYASTVVVTDKVLQLLGQKHSHGCNRINLHKEIIIVRNFIREVSLDEAKKLKDFWASFYTWKTTQWPNGIMPEDWHHLRTEDAAAYDEE